MTLPTGTECAVLADGAFASGLYADPRGLPGRRRAATAPAAAAIELDALADALARLHGHFEVDGHRLTGDQDGVRGKGSIIQSLLKGLDLTGANFGPLSCADIRFEEADLSNSAWSRISVRRVEFSGYRLVSWSVRFERVEDVAFTNCRLDYCSWTAQRLSAWFFAGCTFREAEFDGRLDRFVFRDRRLDGARFDATSAGQCNLREADIAGVNGLLTLYGTRSSPHQAGEAGIILAGEVGISVEQVDLFRRADPALGRDIMMPWARNA